MAESTIVKTKRDGTIRFADFGGANSYDVDFEAGDLNVTIPARTVNLFLNRGEIQSPPSVRYGDDQPSTGTFTAYLRDSTDATTTTLLDILTQSGFVSSTWTSTLGASGEVFLVSITFLIEGTDHGDPADHSLVFNHCYVTGSVAEGDPDVITVNFTSYELYPTIT